MRILSFFTLLACFVTVSTKSNAATIGFDGLKNGEYVLDYYNGGFGSEGSGPGPTVGVTFSAGLAADTTQIAFGNSGLIDNTVTMNLVTPTFGSFSFYFVGQGSVSFYTGRNASGRLVESDSLVYPPFFPFGTYVSSVQSVVFTAMGGPLSVDSITFGGSSPVVPEPSQGLIVALGLILMTAPCAIRRTRKTGFRGRYIESSNGT